MLSKTSSILSLTGMLGWLAKPHLWALPVRTFTVHARERERLEWLSHKLKNAISPMLEGEPPKESALLRA